MAVQNLQEKTFAAEKTSQTKAVTDQHNSESNTVALEDNSEDSLQDRKVAEENISRYLHVDSTIRKIASILDFEYAAPDNALHRLRSAKHQPEETSSTAGARFSKYIFATLPFAAGVCPYDQVAGFVCAANMTARTFWEVALANFEASGIAATLMEYNKHLAVLPSTVKSEHIIRIETARCTSNGGNNDSRDCVIVLRYHRKDEDFDKELEPGRKVAKAMIRREDFALYRVLEQQCLNQLCAALSAGAVCPLTGAPFRPRDEDLKTRFFTQVPSKFLQRGFLRLQRWIHNMGYLSPRLGSLSTEELMVSWAQALRNLGPLNGTDRSDQLFKHSLRHLFMIFGQRVPLTAGPRRLLDVAGIEEPDSPVNRQNCSEILGLLYYLHNNPRKLLDFSSPADGLLRFLTDHKLFIKIHANCWSPRQRHRFADKFFEVLRKASKSIAAEIGLGKAFARPWPFHVTWADDEGEGLFMYLLGIYSGKQGVPPTPPILLERQNLNTHINRLFDGIFSTSDFDQTQCFVQSEIVDQEALQQMLESRPFIQRHVAPCRDLSEDSLPKAEPVLGTPKDTTTTQDTTQSQPPSSRVGGVPDLDAPSSFRTAQSAINRLLWDPAHRLEFHEVGYLDRFLPYLIWKPMEKWKQATEEEDFVPYHRIRQIRRCRDNMIMWDRRERIDLLTTLW